MQIPSAHVGFIDGNGKVLRTVDAGVTWEIVYNDPQMSIVDIYFLDELNGLVSADKNGKSIFLHTYDGGETWTVHDLPITAGKMVFTSINIGHMAAEHGMIYTTMDGGHHWHHSGVHDNVSVGDFHFLTEDVGYFAGWYNGSIVKTSNNGQTWESLKVTGDFLDIFFSSSNVGYTAGLFGGITKTEDGGMTWKSQQTQLPIDINLYSIHCVDDTTCIAVGDSGTVIKTSDGGLHWQQLSTGTKQRLNAIACKHGDCYITGEGGVVLKTGAIITSVNDATIAYGKLKLFPNPSSGSVLASFKAAENQTAFITIHDIHGREVSQLPLENGKAIINGQSLGAGVYSCSLYINNALRETQKLVITN